MRLEVQLQLVHKEYDEDEDDEDDEDIENVNVEKKINVSP